MHRFLLLVFSILLASNVAAQPLFETRAIWLTTAAGLDWPATGTSAASQEASLRNIIARARGKGLNTVFFQVVTRGDAFYQSDRLPWSGILTGTTGKDPGFDPLAVAIEAAHKNGMELHAWINTYRIAKATTGSYTPNHVTEDHPEWTEIDGDWLSPGYPGVNEWIVGNVAELVERYDVDAIHFDFARYNQGGYLRDDSLWVANNPSGIATKADWRRENVNQLMRDVQAVVMEIRPWTKIGSTPIGNYDESCFPGALKGYSDVFQDSRLWLSEGTNDYLAPQLYWADGDANSPSFTCLVKDWYDGNPSRRHLYPGVALYVPSVVSELSHQIDVTRNEGAQGMAFFREAFTRTEDFNGKFDALSLQPPVSLRFEAQAPETPDSVSIEVDGPRTIHIEWTPAAGAALDPLRWYAIFRKSGAPPDVEDANDLAAVVYRDNISFDDQLPDSETGPVFYSIVAVSSLGFVADPTEAISTGMLPTSVEDDLPAGPFTLDGIYPNPANERVSVRFVSETASDATIRVFDELGRIAKHRVVRATSGENVVTMQTGSLPAGLYLIELSSDRQKINGSFVIVR